jgi:hypothetical protein
MMEGVTSPEPFLKYFLILDQDIFETPRYVEFSETNFNTYSLEYLRLLFSVCAEFEIVCKQLCNSIKSEDDFEKSEMDYLTRIILGNFPKITELEIYVPQLGKKILPFTGWGRAYKGKEVEKSGSPFWWQNYNSVKHGRHKNFGRANLKSVLYSLAGLYGILLYFYRIKSTDGEVYFNDMPRVVFYDYGNLLEPLVGGKKCVLPDFPE